MGGYGVKGVTQEYVVPAYLVAATPVLVGVEEFLSISVGAPNATLPEFVLCAFLLGVLTPVKLIVLVYAAKKNGFRAPVVGPFVAPLVFGVEDADPVLYLVSAAFWFSLTGYLVVLASKASKTVKHRNEKNQSIL
jgi:hypothetical protein